VLNPSGYGMGSMTLEGRIGAGAGVDRPVVPANARRTERLNSGPCERRQGSIGAKDLHVHGGTLRERRSRRRSAGSCLERKGSAG
jgi:hypothetical protein